MQPLNSLSLQPNVQPADALNTRHLLCFSVRCLRLAGKRLLLSCLEKEDAGGGWSSWSALNPQQQSHFSIKNNPGVSRERFWGCCGAEIGNHQCNQQLNSARSQNALVPFPLHLKQSCVVFLPNPLQTKVALSWLCRVENSPAWKDRGS